MKAITTNNPASASEVDDHFGEHLMIDGYLGSKHLLDNRNLVLQILDDLPTHLGMKTLAPPSIHYAAGNTLKDHGGWSGFVIIEESHISAHTFPRQGFVSVDVYTCKNGLSTERIVSYFKARFELGETETNFIRRGINFSRLTKQTLR